MLKNYFKTAWRNLTKSKAFSLINIFGLTLGVTCSILIFLWVQDELGYDGFHKNGDRLYTVITHDKGKDGSINNSMSSTPGLLADALKKQVPEVEGAAMVVWEDDMVFTVGNKIAKEKGRYAGQDFFTLFSFPFLQGNPGTALSAPDNIVLTQRLAGNYFQGQDPIGKIVRIDNKRDYIVSGVVADPPANSSIKFDFILPIDHGFEDNHWMVAGWDHFGPPTYILLRKDADRNKVNAKIRNFLAQQDATLADKQLSLQLFKDGYLYSHFVKGVQEGGRIDYIRLFSIVAAFILLIACINFINLATARSVRRAKEVGVRKTMGALKGMLFRQFLAEAILTTLIAVLVSLCFVWLLLPQFNRLTEKQIILHPDPKFIISLAGLTLITGMVAGSYPALFLSTLNPVSVLKGALKFGWKNIILRKGLVVFQFSLSIILVVCTIVVNRQMHYIQTKNLGVDRTNVINCWIRGELVKNFSGFKNEIERSGTIEAMTLSSSNPMHVNAYSHNLQWEGKQPDDKTSLAEMDVNYDFLKTMKIQLLQGRDFSRAYATDTSNFIVNETAANLMKLKNPVGSRFSHGVTKGKIIGIVKDFHLSSLHNPIAPMFICLQPNLDAGVALIRVHAGRTREALTAIEKAFKDFSPSTPFDYSFADEEFNQQYHSEIMVEQLANIFAALAIAISCMGLFGLMMFIAEQRTREVGIRKVLGATIPGIFALLSKDFIKLIGLAMLIASPIGWYVMHSWLQGYAYKTGISVWLFPEAGLFAMLVALSTVSFLVIRAALVNPVRSLRAE